jgi:ribosomal protein S18 acetylase RimI-like enzyme
MPDELTLRDLTPEEYAAYRVHVRDGYADDLVNHGGRDRQAADDKAERDTQELLPESGLPEEQVVKKAELDGRHAGYLWVGPAQRSPGIAWVNDVEVAPELRGRGLGRRLMVEAERVAAEMGYQRIGLNVMGGNTVAIRLYDSLGYVVMDQQMSKPIEGRPPQA